MVFGCKQYCPTPELKNDEQTSNNPSSLLIETRLSPSSQSALISAEYPDSVLNNQDVLVSKWQISSNPPTFDLTRFLLTIDLSGIPQHANIDSAFVTFYCVDKTLSNNITPSAFYCNYSNNSLILHRIIEPWNSSTATWNAMPKVSSSDKIIIPNQGTGDHNPSPYNITSFIQTWHSNSSPNYGMMIRLYNEDENSSRRILFASNFNIISNLRPLLSVYYHE